MNEAITIGLLDDDDGFREALTWSVSRCGYQTISCSEPDELLRKLDPASLGCILLDLRLADCDGITVMRRLRQAEFDAPVVLMTAYGDIPVAVEAVRSGAFAFLEKPFERDELRPLLQNAINTHRDERSRFGPALGVLRRFQGLTPREQEAFWCITRGLSIKAMAVELGNSERTAEVHRARVMIKMDAATVADLVRAAHHIAGAFGQNHVAAHLIRK